MALSLLRRCLKFTSILRVNARHTIMPKFGRSCSTIDADKYSNPQFIHNADDNCRESLIHSLAQLNVGHKICNYIEQQNCKNCYVGVCVAFETEAGKWEIPDIAILCNLDPFVEITMGFLEHKPVVAIEILSPSNMNKDLKDNVKLYAKEGIKYYIIINPAKLDALAYELIGNAYHKIENKKHVLQLDVDCCIPLDVIWDGILR